MTPEEFRTYGHQLVEWIASYREHAARRPVMAQVAPGEIRAQLPPSPPQDPEPFDRVLQDLDAIVMPGISHWCHPRFFGYITAPAAPIPQAARRNRVFLV